MEANNEEMSTANLRMAELTSNLSKAQHDLSIAQKKNKRVLGELRTWKEKALNLESNLKQEKRNNENNITQLGFKMLQFENQLRKEQREIESKFIEKDNQIKILEEVINSLHNRIKKNSLCYNCFVTKHNSPEHGVSPDSFSTKFPLDMDFPDHKPGSHNLHDSRNRNISLPLNMQSPHESPKTNNEFCFHHMLSPVPEELENSFLEHARRVNKEQTIEEEEEEDEEEDGEDKKEDRKQEHMIEYMEKNELTIMKEDNSDYVDDEPVGSESDHKITVVDVNKVQNEAYDEKVIDLEKKEESLITNVEAHDKTKREVDDTEILNSEDKKDPFLPSSVETGRNNECEMVSSDTTEENCDIRLDLNSEIYSVITDIVSRVEQFIEHKQELNIESNNIMVKHSENVSESGQQELDEEQISKTPLSPKSEAIVAELKKAIFDASVEYEKGSDNVIETKEADVDGKVETGTFENEVTNNDSADNFMDTEDIIDPSEPVGIKGGDDNKSLVNINEIDLEVCDDVKAINVDKRITNNEDENEDLSEECKQNENSSAENVVDSLTDYDVIELD